MNISNSNNTTALSEHCCTPGSYQSSPLNNNEQVKHLATGINNDRTWGFFLAKHIYNDIPTNHEQPWNSHLYLYLYLYLSALSKFAIISNIIELILHSLCLSKQSDLLTLYNFEAQPNYLFVTGLCYILKFLNNYKFLSNHCLEIFELPELLIPFQPLSPW